MPTDAHIEQAGGDLLFPGPPLEQGKRPALSAVGDETVEGPMPDAGCVGLVAVDTRAGLPAGAIEDI
jgi:hypothetical protein